VPPNATIARTFAESRLRLDVAQHIRAPDEAGPSDLLADEGRVPGKVGDDPVPQVPPREWWFVNPPKQPLWDRLAFTMQRQQQTNWCWAAVAASVAQYYDPGTRWTQCLVANAQWFRTDCCGGGAAGPCNEYGWLDRALGAVGHLTRVEGGTSTFAVIDAEIAAGRPVGIRVAWRGGGAHFVAIYGTGELMATGHYVAVDDSIYGKSDHTWADLCTSYRGDGDRWTTTFFTKA
jgi:hypothetical protein